MFHNPFLVIKFGRKLKRLLIPNFKKLPEWKNTTQMRWKESMVNFLCIDGTTRHVNMSMQDFTWQKPVGCGTRKSHEFRSHFRIICASEYVGCFHVSALSNPSNMVRTSVSII